MTLRPVKLMAALLAGFLALGMVISPGFPPGYIYPLAWLLGTAVVWRGYRRYRLPGSKAIFLGFALLLVSALVGSVHNLLLLMTSTLPGVPPERAFQLFSPAIELPGLAATSYQAVYHWYTVPVIGLPGIAGAILVVYGLWGIGQEALRRKAGGG